MNRLWRCLESIVGFFKSLFLNGLVTLLPITATIFFVSFTYKLLMRWLLPLRRFLPEVLSTIPAIEIVLFIGAVMVVGAFLKFFVVLPIIHWFEKLIIKIPLVRTVYSSAKTVVDFFNVSQQAEKTMQKVVLVEYPRKHIYSIGFLLEADSSYYQALIDQHESPQGSSGGGVVKVFVPSSPNPTTGYFLLMPRSELIFTDITFEEAIKVVVSCGLITPDSLQRSIAKN